MGGDAVTDIQREYEQQWRGLSSRWLAYCYAVGRHPTGERPPGTELPVLWIGRRMDRACAELGIECKTRLTAEEHAKCTELLWRYAVEERA